MRSTRSCFASQRARPTLDVRFLHFYFIFFPFIGKTPSFASQRAPHTLGVCSHRGGKKGAKEGDKKALIFVVALCRGLAVRLYGYERFATAN